MTVLFGTVEYFEREFLKYTTKNQLIKLTNDQILAIYSRLKDELLHDFICAEGIRMECIENLNQACCKLINSEMRVIS